MLEPCEGCIAVALIHRNDDGSRRRVIIELWPNFDIDSVGEAEAEGLYTDVVQNGWTRVTYQ